MITKTQALTLRHRQNLRMKSYRDGRLINVRVNGACQTWKTRPDDFRVPIKYGLRECGELTHENADRFFMPVGES